MAYWQSELKKGEKRANVYNCEFCVSRGKHRDRQRKQCFKFYDRASIPRARITDDSFRFDADYGEVAVARDQALIEIDRLKRANPDRGLVDLARMLCLCPAGLVDDDDWKYLTLEGAVRDYGADYLRVYGYETAPARIFDSFDIIRSTRNEIEARRFAKE
jgi:hypothetical protein